MNAVTGMFWCDFTIKHIIDNGYSNTHIYLIMLSVLNCHFS